MRRVQLLDPWWDRQRRGEKLTEEWSKQRLERDQSLVGVAFSYLATSAGPRHGLMHFRRGLGPASPTDERSTRQWVNFATKFAG